MSYGAGFPATDGHPEAVLRLRRLRDQGGSDTSHEIRLQRAGLGGGGDAAFRVGQDYAQFEAELGLTNGEGGWLLLARSNRLQHATGIGLDGLDWAVVRAAGLSAEGLLPVSATSDGARPTGGQMSPQWQASGQAWPSWAASAPGSADSLSPVAEAHPWGETHAPGRDHSDTRGQAAVRAGDAPCALPIETAAQENATPAAFPIPTLVYGRPTATGADLVVEAELHLRGWATPNSEVDLFGHRYRVGPGGRFEFVLKVDDPALLRRALAQHPPPELGTQRED